MLSLVLSLCSSFFGGRGGGLFINLIESSVLRRLMNLSELVLHLLLTRFQAIIQERDAEREKLRRELLRSQRCQRFLRRRRRRQIS
jgi:hypothetical protein